MQPREFSDVLCKVCSGTGKPGDPFCDIVRNAAPSERYARAFLTCLVVHHGFGNGEWFRYDPAQRFRIDRHWMTSTRG
jgi:hypothetical protein